MPVILFILLIAALVALVLLMPSKLRRACYMLAKSESAACHLLDNDILSGIPNGIKIQKDGT